MILVFAEIYFVFFNGFSGQPFFTDILPILYNIIWTSWPCIIAFGIDKDLPDDNKTFKFNLVGKYFEIMPALYRAGQIGYYFNLKKFWNWLITAIIHGGTCFIIVELGLENISIFNDGKLLDHWYKTTILFSLIIHIVTYKIFLETTYWNYISLSISIMSVVIYYCSIYLFNIPFLAYIVQNEITMKITSLFSSEIFLCYIIAGPLLAISTDLLIKFLYMLYKPAPFNLVNKLDITITDNIIKRLSTIKDYSVVYQQHHNVPK